MNIMFMGTPEFACVSLRKLCECGYNVSSVVTTEDKPRGRGHKMTHPDVYLEAEKLNIKNIYQPVNLKKESFEDILKKENPDVIVVVAYGKLLPAYVLDFPKYGCINVHGSLLPRYRGAAPMQWAVINGDKETGVTTMYMDTGLDTGDMLLKASIELTDDDNFGTVHDRLALLGGDLLCETLKQLQDGNLERIPQGDAQTPYAKMITKDMTVISWNEDAACISNLIRGLTPFPKASCTFEGKGMKILKARALSQKSDGVAGEIVAVNADSFDVICKNQSVLRVFEIQPEAKKAMTVSQYLAGNSIIKGTVLK